MSEQPRLAISVWHAPWDAKRRANLAQIQARLSPWIIKSPGASWGDAYRVIWKVANDTQHSGWHTFRRAVINGILTNSTHVLILADDMLPCQGFLQLAQAAIACHPESPMCFFSMRGSQLRAQERGCHWVISPEGWWGGASLLPTQMWEDFLAWERANIDPAYKSSDRRVSLFCMQRKLDIWQTVPSLLQHMDPSTSLYGHAGNARRVAALYPEGPIEIDWAGGAQPERERGSMPYAKVWETARRKDAQCPKPGTTSALVD